MRPPARRHALQHEEASANNGEYLGKLTNDHGVQLRSFNDDVWDAFGGAAEEVFAETRDHSPLAAEINDAFQVALREIGAFRHRRKSPSPTSATGVLGL